MDIIAAFLAKLLSLDIVLIAVIAGLLARNWFHVIVGAVVAAIANEMLLTMMQAVRRFDPLTVVIGAVAAAVWVAGAYAIKSRSRKRRDA